MSTTWSKQPLESLAFRSYAAAVVEVLDPSGDLFGARIIAQGSGGDAPQAALSKRLMQVRLQALPSAPLKESLLVCILLPCRQTHASHTIRQSLVGVGRSCVCLN